MPSWPNKCSRSRWMRTGQIEGVGKMLEMFEHSAIYPGREAFVRVIIHAVHQYAPRFDAQGPVKD